MCRLRVRPRGGPGQPCGVKGPCGRNQEWQLEPPGEWTQGLFTWTVVRERTRPACVFDDRVEGQVGVSLKKDG